MGRLLRARCSRAWEATYDTARSTPALARAWSCAPRGALELCPGAVPRLSRPAQALELCTQVG